MNQELTGLTSHEAREKLLSDGYNELRSEKPRTVFSFLIELVKEPMILLLLGAASIYFILGDPKEAALLLVSIVGVVGITLYQERKTEKAIEALKNLSSPVAIAIRDNTPTRIFGREVVKDDLLVINEGDRVPADCVIISATNLLVDESLLTGESLAVTKVKWNGQVNNEKPGGNDLPYIYSGTLIVKGHGLARVIAIGQNTKIGAIGQSLNSLSTEKTLLQKEISIIIRNLVILGLIACLVLIVFYGLTRGTWLEAILVGLTMAMSAVPEEFPIVLTLFMSMGAWRLSQKKVLARRAEAIETLGSTSVLCVDKTGTLTQNKMSINEIIIHDQHFNHNKLDDIKCHETIKIAILASQIEPFDPMETAFINTGKKYIQGFHKLYQDLSLEKEYPLEKTSLTVVQAWKKLEDDSFLIAAKGSPESIMHLCQIPEENRKSIYHNVQEMAKKGLRIIGVATALYNEKTLPNNREKFNYKFLGLVGLSDPIRDGMAQAIQLCYSAGIRTIMITGDYAETAKNIAGQIGLVNYNETITGSELEKMSEDELMIKIKTINVFSRVMPEQKLMIVNALKKDGEIVAMTGDGVNDAPALKSAHIGIAMGDRGTDVAREAAAIVLQDDNFSSIVNGVKLGRRIYDNLKKAVVYLFVVHIQIAGLSLLPVFFGWPLILMPAHIVFLELIIDPASTIVFENEQEDKNIMNRKPRKITDTILSKEMVLISIFQGLISLIIVLMAYRIAVYWGLNEGQARAFTFTTLVFSNLFILITNRSWDLSIIKLIKKVSISFISISISTIIFLVLSLYWPAMSRMFHFESISLKELGLSFILASMTIIWFEVYKIMTKK